MSFTSVSFSCSACVIWPTFSSSVIVARRAFASASWTEKNALRAAAGAAEVDEATTVATVSAPRAARVADQVFMTPPAPRLPQDSRSVASCGTEIESPPWPTKYWPLPTET
jgi:hypothetical protein